MTIQIPDNCTKILVQFRLPGPLLWDYPGLENRGVESAKKASERATRSEKYPSKLLLQISPEKGSTGAMTGVPDTFGDFTLVRASVEERESRGHEIVLDNGDVIDLKPKPFQFLSFTFVRNLHEGTKPLSKEVFNQFAKYFGSGWCKLEVYENTLVANDVATEDCMLSILFAGHAGKPKSYELGDELVTGVSKIINTTKKLREAEKRRVSDVGIR